MNFLKNIFGPSQYPVVIVQYECNDYSADNPEQLGQLIKYCVIKPERPAWPMLADFRPPLAGWERRLGTLRWQVSCACEYSQVSRWRLHRLYRSKEIGGHIKGGDVISSNQPAVKFQGWNCRDWIMEVVALLKRNGFIDYKIPAAQEGLFQALRIAGHKTLALRETGNNSEVEIVQINE
ncbi:hypothetical protein H0H93_003912 [Arthromyces matolae]|nr:hypothetical protein H0H93_003912 [Arthromyces matolae]